MVPGKEVDEEVYQPCCGSLCLALAPASWLYGGIQRKGSGRIGRGHTHPLLVDGKRQIKVRLAEIDAPEGGQPYGNRAKQELSALTFNKEARVRVQDTDRYGRTVGRVFVGSVDVSAEMVRRGAAWVFS